jgi:hypothetical protein
MVQLPAVLKVIVLLVFSLSRVKLEYVPDGLNDVITSLELEEY